MSSFIFLCHKYPTEHLSSVGYMKYYIIDLRIGTAALGAV